MIIGVPREIKNGERRVALTPDAVAVLVAAGHSVRVENAAGAGAGFADADYAAAGAEMVGSAAKAFDVELVVKVKEIQTGPANDWHFLNPGSMLFCFLHLGADAVMAHELLARRITGIALGADVTVISRVGPRLAALAHKLGSSARTVAMHAAALAGASGEADVVIGAVNVPGTATPKLLTREDVRAITDNKGPGAVLIEICIDGGGGAETSHPTRHSAPTYVDEGVTHYCVANMPAAVPRSASLALSAVVLPRVAALAGKGLTHALRDDDGLAAGLQIHGGQVTHPAIARELKRPHRDLDAMLFSC